MRKWFPKTTECLKSKPLCDDGEGPTSISEATHADGQQLVLIPATAARPDDAGDVPEDAIGVEGHFWQGYTRILGGARDSL
ncbi:MAG: hypothetical protein HYS12_29735 [Planctomycetes bacterium]|nr:hypothetical protein [Planctomycetota bacterium]